MIDLTASDYNLQSLDQRQLLAHIKASIQAHSNLFVVGRRGVGKSQMVKQAIKELNHTLVFLNLSMYDRPDVGGYPNIFNSPDEFVHVLLPNKFKPLVNGNEPCVLLCDELDKASEELNAPLLEVIEDKCLNGTPLPNLVSVISTGNLPSEGGKRPITPLLDRTEKYLLDPTVEAWQEWAGTANIHPSVLSFIHDKPNRLIGAIDHPTYYASESPRAWHKVSNIAHFAEDNDWDVELVNEKASGFVGKQAGLDFQLYFTQYKRLLPIVDGVFGDRDYKKAFDGLYPNEKLYVAMIVSSRFAVHMDAHKPSENSSVMKQVLKATGTFYDRLYKAHPEYVLLCMSNQITNKRWLAWKLDEIPEWKGVLPALASMAKK